MSIRVKLAMVLSAGMALAVLASAGAFVQFQRGALRMAAEESDRLLLESVARMAGESQLARDPLMLLDYLAFLRKDRAEVHHCRVHLGGRWEEVGGKAPPPPAGGTIRRTVEVPGREGSAAISVEVLFDRSVLALREQQARQALFNNVAHAGGLAVVLGVLIAVPLSRTMTRRIVVIERALEEIGKGRLGQVADSGGADELARLARGVNQMSAKLKELEQLKKTFVASVTHELRSPLGAIESQVKDLLARSSALTEEDRATLARVQKNAIRLEHFVTSLLEMSKIERGKLEMHLRAAEIGPLVRDTAAFFAPRAREAGLSVSAHVEPDLPSMKLDPDLIAQVLTNLVSNAIKFTRPGGAVRLTARPADRGGRAGVECAVEDTGVGIPAEALDRIFAPFERVRNPLRATGAGLGLAISKAIVEMHGGSMAVSSSPGRGSRFSFFLPRAPVAAGAAGVEEGRNKSLI